MTKTELSVIRAVAGSKGGRSTLERYGREYMSMIGRKGGMRYLPFIEIENKEEGGVATKAKGIAESKLHFKSLQALHLEKHAGRVS